jgi:hypothetical protein
LKHAIEETVRSERHKLSSEGNIECIRKNYLRESNAGKWFDQLETESGT